eukprot:scaffold209597_cov18-Tisochrysis_lutea.AAC.2
MAEIEQQPMESIQEEDSTSDADEDEDVESSHQRRPDHATNGHTPLGTNGRCRSNCVADFDTVQPVYLAGFVLLAYIRIGKRQVVKKLMFLVRCKI